MLQISQKLQRILWTISTCLMRAIKKVRSTFPAGIWLFEINTTSKIIINVKNNHNRVFWRYCDDFQQVNSRRWVAICMFILYCNESGQNSSFRSENLSLLKSGICLNGVQVANSLRISDRRFEYLRYKGGGPFFK